MNLCDYTTVQKLKDYKDADQAKTASNGLLLDCIRQASREVEAITNRWFYPRMVANRYDTPRGANIELDMDYLEVTSLVNGDGTIIDASNYRLYPLNKWPKYELRLLNKSYVWLMDSYGNPDGAIQLSGMCGYSDDYPSAWEDSGATLQADITSTSQSTVTVTAGQIQAGDLLKIDSEFIYVSALETGNPDTVTLKRGVNGSTAATHSSGAAIYRWNVGPEIEMLVTRAAVAYTKLRANPTAESISVDGITYSTPKDVIKWMDQQLRGLGLIRVGMG